MNVIVVLAMAGLLAGPASPSAADPSGGGDVVIEHAGTITRQADGRVRLEGDVVVRRGTVTLRARTATVDPATGEVDAAGGVLLTDVSRAVAADGIHAVLGGPFEAEQVVAFVKDGPVPLGSATSVDDARHLGRNRLSFSGKRLAGDSSGRFSLSDARLTLCDCAGGAPSWEIRARSADVVPGKRAILSWPVIYVTPRFLFVKRPVPVLPLPWLYFPLSSRQTGLLIPTIGSRSTTGFEIAQPVFVTLGPSADMTITPQYFSALNGPTEADIAAGKAAVRGFGAALELRWAPAAEASGIAMLTWVNDRAREPGGGSGDRLEVAADHQQRLGGDTRLRLDVGVSSDPVWPRDFTTDVLLKQAFYRRSDVIVSHRSEALVVEGDAAYYEPLAPSGWARKIPSAVPGLGEPAEYGLLGAAIPVFHRWPGIAATLLPEAAGPVEVSGRVGLARFAPASGDASAIALGPGDPGGRLEPNTPAPPGSGLDGQPVVYATPREAATRLDARLELRAPVLLGGAVAVEPYLGGAGAGYVFDTSRDAAAVAWAVGGVALSTDLTRAYGGVVHHVAPRLEVRAGTDAAGPGGHALDLPALDAWDRVRDAHAIADPSGSGATLQPARTLSASPDGTFRQLRVALVNRLTHGGVDRLRLEVGQDLDLRLGRLGETFVTASGRAGPLAADAAARFLAFQGRAEPAPAPSASSWLDAFTELRAGVSLADARGDTLRAGLLAVGPGASGTLMAGVDPLFDLRPAPVQAVAQGSFGARAAFGGASVGYDALFTARPDVKQCGSGGPVGAGHIQQHTGSFVWSSPCRCFLAALAVTVNACGETSYRASLDLSRLGDRSWLR